MGCTSSQPTSPQSVQNKSPPKAVENSFRKSAPAAGGINENMDVSLRAFYNDARVVERFADDKALKLTLPAPYHMELRCMLEDPIGLNFLGKYSDKIRVLELFMCWVDIQEFKMESYRHSKALYLFHKYIAEDAVLFVGFVSSTLRNNLLQQIESSLVDGPIATLAFYNKIQSTCFMELYHNVYKPFQMTNDYRTLSQELRNGDHKVKPEDFQYFTKLGDTKSGLMVHCIKKQSGKHYAMRIQSKAQLLQSKVNPATVVKDREAYSQCQHPFIVNLDYAFQSHNLVFMVLEMTTAGDLQSVVKSAPKQQIAEDRVRFYAAEIVLALSYLHSMGLVYRDLKPQNVLCDGDGHVKLADIGGAGTTVSSRDANYDTLRCMAPECIRTIFAATGGSSSSQVDPMVRVKQFVADNQQSVSMKVRSIAQHNADVEKQQDVKLTLHEVVSGKMKAFKCEITMDMSADWWSLGMIMYKLLTGVYPYTDDQLRAYVAECSVATGGSGVISRQSVSIPEDGPTDLQVRGANGTGTSIDSTTPSAAAANIRTAANNANNSTLAVLGPIEYPAHISSKCKELISRLLDLNPKTRFGEDDIKSHPFFAYTNWDEVEQKLIDPPHKHTTTSPAISLVSQENNMAYASLADFLKKNEKEKLLESAGLTDVQQNYFNLWDFTSAHALRVEAGLTEMKHKVNFSNYSANAANAANRTTKNDFGEKDDGNGIRGATAASSPIRSKK